MKTLEILGYPVACTTYREAASWVFDKLDHEKVYAVEAANTHVLALARSEDDFHETISKFDLILPDGMPLIWALNRQLIDEEQLKDRVYGPSFMLEVLKSSPPKAKHFLLGGKQSTLDHLEERFGMDYPETNIVGSYSPPFGHWDKAENQKMFDLIKSSGANLVWVGLGCPKQEHWIAKHKHQLPPAVYFGIGAAFAFHSGEVPQAPRMMQQIGMEWLYRLLKEPKRLFKRYLVNNTRFIKYYIVDTIFSK